MAITLYLLAVAVGALGLLYLHFRRAYRYWSKRGVYTLPPSFPFGNMGERILMRQSSVDFFTSAYHALKDHRFGGMYQVQRPALVICDPAIVKQILVKDFPHFQDRGSVVDEKNNPLSAHLFNLGGSRWRKLRTKLTPTFTSGKMKLMFGLMRECAGELAYYLQEPARAGDAVEFKEVLAKFTTDVIGTCAFGVQCNSMKDPDSEFRAMGRRVFRPSTMLSLRLVVLIAMPVLARFFKVQFPEKDVSDFFLRAVKETVDFREKHDLKRNDFLQLLIELRKKSTVDGASNGATNAVTNGAVNDAAKGVANGVANGVSSGVANGVAHGVANGEANGGDHTKTEGVSTDGDIELTDNLLAAQAFVFFIAGFETSSATMSFALYELAANPEVQTRLREEINSVLESSGGVCTYDTIMKMEYLDKVVSETLRKYPPLPGLVRECTIPYTIPGTDVHIEKGVRVIIPVHGLQNDSKYFKNPEIFDPERFNEENKATRPHYVYMPFGEGPRLCIGMRFGQMQTKLGLAMLLKQYHFTISDKTKLPLQFDPKTFLTATVGGMWLNITPLI